MRQQRHVWWGFGALLIAAVWSVSACGEGTAATDPGAGTSSGGSTTSGGTSGGIASTSGGTSGTTTSSGGPSDASSDGGGSSGDPTLSTPPNFKVAFIGDTDQGNDFKAVLGLIKAEGADAVLVQGDLTYSFHTAASWFTAADSVLQAGGTNIPYFASKGNHDWDWTMPGGLGAGFDTKVGTFGATLDNNKPSDVNYAMTFKGLKLVFVGDSGSQTTRADYVKTQLANDKHYWKICSWHKNMRDTNVGPKDDEMSWAIYENCRSAGAIVAQGHSHTYSRSKTLTADQALTVDPACSDPFALCVGPGKHFFFDSSIGGEDLRTLEETNKPHYAAFDATNFGALFIEFNVDGDPRKAKGYFKNIGNTIIDPPGSSGKTSFTITSSN